MAVAPHTQASPLTAFVAMGLLLACLFMAPTLQADGVEARVDRQTVYQGDVLTLSITLEGARVVQPDLRPLEDDFELLGSRSSTEVQIVNGDTRMQRQWHVELAPRRSGELQIPALQVGDAWTSPLTVTVTDSPPAGPGSDDIAVEVSVDTGGGAPYVQSQILYTVRLFYGIPLLEGSLADPQPLGAMVERLGEDRSYRTQINDRRFGVVERRYAIFPETSGEFTIPEIQFRGRAASPDSGRQGLRSSAFDGLFDRGQRVSASAEALTLEVLPRPADYQGHWLPARDLRVQEVWHGEADTVSVGEPLRRSILLEVVGVGAAHLPELGLPAVSGLRIYPEPAETETRSGEQGLVARQLRHFSLIPTVEGTLEIPELRIPWWDLSSGERRVARLSARTVEVVAAAGTAPATPSMARAAQTPGEDDGAGARVADTTANDAVSATAKPAPHWLFGLGAAALLTLLVAGVGHLWQRFVPTQWWATWWQLRGHCRRGRIRPAAHALLAWSAQRWPYDPPRNLGELATRLDATQATQVRALAQALYAPEECGWRGKDLWRVVRVGLRTPVSRTRPAAYVLPPLYSQQ